MPKRQATTAPANKTAILAIILVSYVMIVLDISVVLTGLPNIHHELGFTDAGLAWVQSAYTLTFGGFLLLGARAGDILGRRRMFIIGMAIFTLASVAIGASQSSAWMLSWRAIQGLGSAILAPSTLALLQINFEEGEERVRAVSLYSAAAGVSATVGLIAGGLLADWLSWRAGFLINLPIGIAMILAARACIPETAKQPGALDVPGALSSTIGMSGLVYGFIRSAQAGWDTTTIAILVISITLLGLFILIERRARQPILPLRLFSDLERSGAYGARVLYLGAMVGFFFFTTLYLQEVAGLRPALTGLAFVPATMLHVPIAMIVPRLIQRFGRNMVLVTGTVVGIVAMGWLSRAGIGSNYWTAIAMPMILIGISQGLVLSPLTSSGVARVDHADAGAASGAVNVAHQMGSSVGLSLLIAIAAIGSAGLTGAELTAYRVSHAFEAGTVMLMATLVIALLTIVPAATRRAPAETEAAPTESAA
ncbi:MFS transporter [Agrobacterium genomosp. 3]|uniref:MFS transporter n=1 Tax=Rhizobium/Agrobacterium group TaxID=227290 RepID=UPI001CD8CD52|nr:MFS transporter [Rhizobium rhizogenes]MCA1864330.1 MFS transporter [Agrobacterium tomkonis]MCA1874683.1 MFS transporter [Agrobacterium tumefaciens]MCA1890598.1 MFS transporter [Agrobacterium tomkonis]MCZ7452156.1 MFS transporter [Rhizobium rhizogenes]